MPKNNLRNADLLLLLLFLLMAAIILFRINAEATGYLSPDSEAYLSLAQNILDGHGLYEQQADGSRRYFSTWPIGYPMLIALITRISPLSVFWASKLLNLLLLGGGFLLLRHLCRPYAFLLVSLYGSYTLLEVYSFTWSEAPFLLALLLLCYLSRQILEQGASGRYVLLLFLTCAYLFLMRYVGAFSFGMPLLLGVYLLQQKRRATGMGLLLTAALLVSLAGGYLYLNYRLSGFATGFDRLEDETEPIQVFLGMLAEGMGNELLLIRKYRAGNQPDILLYLTVLLQLATTAYIAKAARKQLLAQFRHGSFTLVCWLVAGLYLLALLFLRSLSHFDDLDYRLLAPCSFLFWMGILYALAALPDSRPGNVRAKYAAFGFLLLALLLNLPKQYLLAWLQDTCS